MKLPQLPLLILSSIALLAIPATSRLIIVNFPKTTTDEIYGAAKNAFLEAGGTISHEFNLIRAFSAEAGDDAINSLKSWTVANEGARGVEIEDEQIISIPKTGPQ